MNRTLWLRLSLAAVVAVSVWGCGSKEKPAPEPAPAPAPAPSVSGSEPSAPTVPLSSLPDELKHEAFEYYGLGNDQPMDLERTIVGQPDTVTGSQSFRLKEVKDGKALFTVVRTGGFASVGDSDLSLELDGIYAMSSTIGTITPHQLELPAKLGVGAKWDAETKLEQGGGITLEHKSVNKVVGMQKVTTPAGTYDALLIESSGPAKIQGEAKEMRTKAWFVKGLGAVKMEIVEISKGGSKQTILIQNTK